MSKEKWSLGMESTADENSVKTVEITANNLEFYINLVHKTAAGCERIDSSFESITSDKNANKHHCIL